MTKQDQISENEHWGRVHRSLFLWAVKRHHLNHADAEEVVQEAITQLLANGESASNDPKNLLEVLGSRCNGIIRNRRTKKALKAVGFTTDGVVPDNDDGGYVEKKLIGDEYFRKAISLILDRIEHDNIATQVFFKMIDGLEKPAEIAKALEMDALDVYNARRRLDGHVAAIKVAMEKLS